MIWWYKDIFISRGSNLEIEHRSVKTKKRPHTLVKSYEKLKAVIHSVIDFQRSSRLKRHSYRLLSQLEDHYLADIGLTNEDLYLFRKGIIPQRFQQKTVENTKPVGIRLVSSKSAVDQKSGNMNAESDHIDKAA